MPGTLITFEGIDRCGKTTQIQLLSEWLKNQRVDFVLAHEPGGTAVGEVMRHTLKFPQAMYGLLNRELADHHDYAQVDAEEKRTAESECFMYLASRADLARKVVLPALEDGKVVVKDRGAFSTRAYQGGGLYRSAPDKIDLINRMNDFALGGRWPDLTLLLDIPVSVMRQRKGLAEVDDELERRKCEFFERSIREYHVCAKERPDSFVVADATRSASVVFEEYVRPAVEKLLDSRC